MKVESKVSPATAQKLKEINSIGSVGTKTKIVVEADEKLAKESLAQLGRPSAALKKFASVLKRLNSF